MNKLSKPLAIISDMDGTIVDSEKFAKAVWRAAADEMGIDVPERIYNEMVGSSVEKTKSLFTDFFGEDFAINELRALKTKIELSSYDKGLIKEKEGASEFLQCAKNLKISLGLATTTERFRADKRLVESGLIKYFDFTLCGDEVENQKPDPEMYLKVAKNLNVPIQDCWVIEDSFSGVSAGVASGAQTIWIKDFLEIPENLKSEVTQMESLSALKMELEKVM